MANPSPAAGTPSTRPAAEGALGHDAIGVVQDTVIGMASSAPAVSIRFVQRSAFFDLPREQYSRELVPDETRSDP